MSRSTDVSFTMKLEVVAIPVSDVDRAKGFFENLGWRLDADFDLGEGRRVVQFTPTDSDCSIAFGKGFIEGEPGSIERLEMVVSDIEAAREFLIGRGVEVSDFFHRGESGIRAGPGPGAHLLQQLRHVQRSGRQRVPPPGGHGASPGRLWED